MSGTCVGCRAAVPRESDGTHVMGSRSNEAWSHTMKCQDAPVLLAASSCPSTGVDRDNDEPWTCKSRKVIEVSKGTRGQWHTRCANCGALRTLRREPTP